MKLPMRALIPILVLLFCSFDLSATSGDSYLSKSITSIEIHDSEISKKNEGVFRKKVKNFKQYFKNKIRENAIALGVFFLVAGIIVLLIALRVIEEAGGYTLGYSGSLVKIIIAGVLFLSGVLTIIYGYNS